MRAIKFRGKKISNGEWVYGAFKKYTDHPGIVAIMEEIEAGTIYSVVPETVGQYTGLKDKNNKEIYEGDIYIAERGYMASRGYKKKEYPNKIKVICVVEWSVYDAGWYGQERSPIKEHIEFSKNAPYHYIFTSLHGSQDGNADWIEVIGNIHDNKDLIPKT